MYLIKNAKIWTANKECPKAEAMLVQEEEIICIGSLEKVEKRASQYAKSEIQILDVQGKRVIPNFVDCHIHVTSVAKSMWYLLLERKSYHSLDEVLEPVAVYAREHSVKEVPFLYATSCPMECMDNATKEDFDRYVSDRPALLCDEGYHRCLVNSKMLELMEIDSNTPYDPSSSMNYGRNEDNSPNGLVYEHRYEQDIDKMFEKIGWYPPDQKDPKVIEPFLTMLNKWGVTGVLDGFTENENTMIGMQCLEQEGKLHHYYRGNVLFKTLQDLEEAIRKAKEWKKKYKSKYIDVDSCKLFLDGTNEIGTASYLEPVEEDPNNFGVINMSQKDLTKALLRLNEEKLHLQIHLVGDRAFRVAINAYEQAKKITEEKKDVWYTQMTLLHCELTKPVDRKRIRLLGIRINVTPHWSGGIFGDGALKYIGQERFDTLYSFNDMIKDGAVVSCSSDVVDLEDMPRANPFVGIQIGYTRQDKDSLFAMRQPKEECMSREDLMYGYTMQGARCMRIDDIAGSLEEGKKANFSVLDRDVFEVPAQEISKILVEKVFFEGKEIV